MDVNRLGPVCQTQLAGCELGMASLPLAGPPPGDDTGHWLDGDGGDHFAEVGGPGGVAGYLDGILGGTAPEPAEQRVGGRLDQGAGVVRGAVGDRRLAGGRAD